MADKPKGPRLAVDNEPENKRRFRRAQRRAAAKNPKYTYDDVLAEEKRIKEEEDKNRG